LILWLIPTVVMRDMHCILVAQEQFTVRTLVALHFNPVAIFRRVSSEDVNFKFIRIIELVAATVLKPTIGIDPSNNHASLFFIALRTSVINVSAPFCADKGHVVAMAILTYDGNPTVGPSAPR
jgi:hypothetical protein